MAQIITWTLTELGLDAHDPAIGPILRHNMLKVGGTASEDELQKAWEESRQARAARADRHQADLRRVLAEFAEKDKARDASKCPACGRGPVETAQLSAVPSTEVVPVPAEMPSDLPEREPAAEPITVQDQVTADNDPRRGRDRRGRRARPARPVRRADPAGDHGRSPRGPTRTRISMTAGVVPVNDDELRLARVHLVRLSLYDLITSGGRGSPISTRAG